jgi:ArsR family transcriptional regulator
MAPSSTLDHAMLVLRALNDPTRVRLLAALEREELTVGELERVLDVPQSRVSTHLARLKEAGLALDRTDGPHRYYRLANGSMPAAAQNAWAALRGPLEGDPQLERDRARLAQVLEVRAGKSWVDRVAGTLDRNYSPGRTWEALARALALLTDLGDVVDFGAGDGSVAELLAGTARRIVGVDESARMVQAGRARLEKAGLEHVELLLGDMHTTGLKPASFDLVLMQQSLQYAREPGVVWREAARLLRPGGRVLCVTLAAHRHEEVRATYGHLHLGFRPAQLKAWVRAAGLTTLHLTSAGRERRPPQFEALALVAQKKRRREEADAV